MEITIQLIKQLRDKTGAGMADCKSALIETKGDIEKAIEYLRKKGAATATKRADKVAKEGAVKIAVNDDRTKAAIIEVNCETDFVAKGDGFQGFALMVAELCLNTKVDVNEKLLAEKTKDGLSLQETINGLISSVGEKIELRRSKYFEINDGFISDYLHFGSKLGGLLKIKGNKNESSLDLGHKLSMQLVAMNPIAICRDDVSKEIMEKEKEIYTEAAKNEGKPANIIERIVQNKVEKFYQENCLLEQEYINESGKSISDLIKEYEKKSGEKFEIIEMARFQLGA